MTKEEAVSIIEERIRVTECVESSYVDCVDIEALRIAIKALQQPEQRWIPCGKCIHADGKHRWCKVLDRTINEDYFCYWAEPYREEGGE